MGKRKIKKQKKKLMLKMVGFVYIAKIGIILLGTYVIDAKL